MLNMQTKTLESGSYPAFNSVCFVVPATVDDDERIDAFIATQVGDLTVLQTAKICPTSVQPLGKAN